MELAKKHCKPCEGTTRSFSETEENLFNKRVHWEIDRDGVHKIRKIFTFKNFEQSMSFVNRVAALAEKEGHHPDFNISYRKVIVELHTHAILGLSENDFILAAKIDQSEKEAYS